MQQAYNQTFSLSLLKYMTMQYDLLSMVIHSSTHKITLVIDFTENDLKLMGVKRWRKKDDRPVWVIILKEAVVKYKDRVQLKKEGTRTST